MIEYFYERDATLTEAAAATATSAVMVTGEEPFGLFIIGTSTTQSPLLLMGLRSPSNT